MAHFLNGENYCDELVHVHNLGVWDPGETGFENKYWLQQVHRWEKVQKIIKLLYGQEMVQRQHSYKNTPLLPSEFTHGMFQLPRPPELFLFMARSRPWITIKLEVWKVQSTS